MTLQTDKLRTIADELRLNGNKSDALHINASADRLEQLEALEMIARKLARIINGDPNYADSWVDIADYAKLVADRLLPEKEA